MGHFFQFSTYVALAFVVNAFRHRDVSRKLGMGVMLLSILSYYAAYVIVAAAALMILWLYNDIRQWMVVAVAVPGTILLVKKWGVQERFPAWLTCLELR